MDKIKFISRSHAFTVDCGRQMAVREGKALNIIYKSLGKSQGTETGEYGIILANDLVPENWKLVGDIDISGEMFWL